MFVFSYVLYKLVLFAPLIIDCFYISMIDF